MQENRNIEELKNKEIEYFADKEGIKKELGKIGKRKVVLIKASRGMKLEEVIED